MRRVETTGALMLTGTVGAGKTTVAEAVGGLLGSAGVPYAVIDVDWLRQAWPTPPGDPFNVGLGMRNLRSVCANYLQAGAVRLVLAGVLETLSDRQQHQSAVGAPLTVCRLRVDLSVVRARLERRHELDAEGRDWHLHRSGELEAIVAAAGVEDFIVDATACTPVEAARAVLTGSGWLADC